MPQLSIWLQIGAIASILPLIAGRGAEASVFRLPLFAGVAAAGTAVVVVNLMANGWIIGFSASLWVIVAATLAVFLCGAVFDNRVRGLAVLVALYTLPLAGMATIWEKATDGAVLRDGPNTWTQIHVATAVLTFALLTIAACAGVAVLLRERALKRKRADGLMNGLIRDLPAVRDAERLQFQLLSLAAVLLAIGIASGEAVSVVENGAILFSDHKSILTLIAFAAIVSMLIAHWRFGLRGRQAVRYLLGAHLALTLAYPGVKFVTDVLLV